MILDFGEIKKKTDEFPLGLTGSCSLLWVPTYSFFGNANDTTMDAIKMKLMINSVQMVGT